ncbi:cupin-like domain-containing protein [Hyphococcus sp.]|jgi:mannose-6-phosphate isomerase-like protein (cupin superfamily)|uniref:cupin-like domain-containing protein n=1 Tax=Hyphococcus sp. TaxID=2038636 RepID=UPI003D12B378
MVFDPASLRPFSASYPNLPARLRHHLTDHPLLEIDRLVVLARVLPESAVEYNSGDLPIGQDPAKTPMNGLTPEETVRRIAENKSWIVLKNIEQDGDYAALLEGCAADVAPSVKAATGEMHKCEGFIFVSSPASVTPFHMDPEHNILMQMRGTKTFTIFPAKADAIVTDEQHEAFHRAGGHRNLPYKDEYASLAENVELSPGDALYVPLKSPHWVKVGPEVSVSLSVTWRSEASDAEAQLRRANGWLRSKGLTPPRPGAAPMRDRAAILAARLAARLKRS